MVRLGPEDVNTLTVKAALSTAYIRAGRHEEAATLRDDVLPVILAKFGPANPVVLRLLLARAEGHAAAGRRADAATAAGEYAGGARKAWARDPQGRAVALAAAGRVLLGVGDHAAAVPVFRDCLAATREVGPNHWSIPAAETLLGSALLGQGNVTEAEPLLLSGYRGLADVSDPTAWVRPADAARRVADLYDAVGKTDEARAWRAAAARPVRDRAPPPRPVGR